MDVVGSPAPLELMHAPLDVLHHLWVLERHSDGRFRVVGKLPVVAL